jgi:hypothetical protein
VALVEVDGGGEDTQLVAEGRGSSTSAGPSHLPGPQTKSVCRVGLVWRQIAPEKGGKSYANKRRLGFLDCTTKES